MKRKQRISFTFHCLISLQWKRGESLAQQPSVSAFDSAETTVPLQPNRNILVSINEFVSGLPVYIGKSLEVF